MLDLERHAAISIRPLTRGKCLGYDVSVRILEFLFVPSHEGKGIFSNNHPVDDFSIRPLARGERYTGLAHALYEISIRPLVRGESKVDRTQYLDDEFLFVPSHEGKAYIHMIVSFVPHFYSSPRTREKDILTLSHLMCWNFYSSPLTRGKSERALVTPVRQQFLFVPSHEGKDAVQVLKIEFCAISIRPLARGESEFRYSVHAVKNHFYSSPRVRGKGPGRSYPAARTISIRPLAQGESNLVYFRRVLVEISIRPLA